MNTSPIRVLIPFLLSIFIYGCEYERIEASENECDPETFELIIESVKNTACAVETGEIEVNVNGDAQYQYRINNGDFTEDNVFSGLGAGNYTVQAKVVSSDCLSETVEVTIENEDGLKISLLEKSDSECGANTGSIVVGQEGGVEPIEYIINDAEAQASSEFTGLSSGDYSILARDASGCEAEISGIEINTNISFANDVESIIATNCAVSGCHNGSQSPDLSVKENIIQNASRIKTRTGNGTMPPAGRPDLTEDEIQAIACWVDGGALDN